MQARIPIPLSTTARAADDEGMDGETARRIIRSQDEEVRARLRQMLAERGRKAQAVAAALRPWRNGSATTLFTGRAKPEALRALADASRWASANRGLPGGLRYMITVSGHEYGSLGSPEVDLHYEARDLERFRQGDADAARAIENVYLLAEQIAENCRGARIVGSALDIPDEFHPPRYGQLLEGTLARLVAEDLADHINTGRALEERLTVGGVGETTVQSWRAKVLESTAIPYLLGFMDLTRGLEACESPVVTDPVVLSRAYLALGLAYLEEVQQRMPDYAEASGQAVPEPRISLSFSGGTFYGGQFAAQIANIDSTIAGVVQHGSPDVAEALKELEQAVLHQAGLDEDERRDLLDNVGYLAEAAQTPSEQRNRGIIRSVLSSLTVAAASGEELRRAMDAWGGVLHGLLP